MLEHIRNLLLNKFLFIRVHTVGMLIDGLSTTGWSNAVTRRSINLGNTGSNPVQVKDLTRLVVP